MVAPTAATSPSNPEEFLNNSHPLDAAKTYARMGISSLAVRTWVDDQTGDKHSKPVPLTGLKEATTDTATFERWWAQEPTAGIGVVPGSLPGFLIVDADGPKERAFIESMLGAPTVLTPSSDADGHGGGAHWWVFGLDPILLKELHIDAAHRLMLDGKPLAVELIGAGSGLAFAYAPPTVRHGRPQPYRFVNQPVTADNAPAFVAWLEQLRAMEVQARAEREAKRASYDEERNANLNEWMREQDWTQMLTADGWVLTDTTACGCPQFRHPFGATSDRSAIAHEEWCDRSQSSFPGGALKVWSPNARDGIGTNDSVLSKYGYVLHARYNGNGDLARTMEGIPPDFDKGKALEFDHSTGQPILDADSDMDMPNLDLSDTASAPSEPDTNGAPVNLTGNPFMDLAGKVQQTTVPSHQPIQPVQASAAPTATPVPQPVSAQVPGAQTVPVPFTPRTAEEIRDELARIESEELVFDVDGCGKVMGWDGIRRTPEEHIRVTKHKQLADLFFTATPELANAYNCAVTNGVNPFGFMLVLIPRVLSEIPPNVVMLKRDGTVPIVREAGGSLNTITYLVAGTSMGKGATEAAVAEFYPVDTEVKPVGTSQGIYKSYMVTQKGKSEDGAPVFTNYWMTDSVIVNVTEIGTLNAELDREGSSTAAGLCQLVMGELAGSNTGEADRRTHLPAHMYRFAMILFGQPTLSAPLLSFTGMGLPGRISWGTCKPDWDYQPIGTGQWSPLTKHTMPWTNQNIANSPHPNFGGVVDRQPTVNPPTEGMPMFCVPWAPAAVTQVKAAQKARTRYAIENGFLEQAVDAVNNADAILEGHETMATLKQHVALSVMHGRYQPTDLDWYLAQALRLMSKYTRRAVVHVIDKLGDVESSRKAEQQGRNKVTAEEAANALRQERISSAMQVITRRVGERESWSRGEMSQYMFKGTQPERRAEYRDAALRALVQEGVIEQVGDRYRKKAR